MEDAGGREVWRKRRCSACGRAGNALLLVGKKGKAVRMEMRCKFCGVMTIIYEPKNEEEKGGKEPLF